MITPKAVVTGLAFVALALWMGAGARGITSTSVEVRVAAASDDAEESATGALDLGSSDLELVYDGSNQFVGIRVTGLAVPPGATVVSSWLQFTADEAHNGVTALAIQAEAADNPTTFTTATGNISSRPRGSASVSWSPAAWGTIGETGEAQRTPDISPVIQQVVSRPGWASGNALVIIITGSGRRTAENFNGAPTQAPLLHVEYTSEAGSAPAVTIDQPSEGTLVSEGVQITFSGTAMDAESGDLSSTITWTSNRDGMLGTGSAVTVNLSPGNHVVTAAATDGLLTGSDWVTVRVSSGDPVVVGAGDISSCSDEGDSATAQLIAAIPGATVFTLGDNVYPSGTAEQYTNCYDPTWGAFKAVTRPTPGNHEYDTSGAPGYFGYFGAAAGDPAKGYYSYDVGTWHMIALNSNCSAVGGCERGSPQGSWLAADLAAHPADCTIAYFHHPRFSSAGSSNSMTGFWELLFEARADVVLSGHTHVYERFAAQDPSGVAAPGRGIREFIVGVGGETFSSFNNVEPNSEVRLNDRDGVLALILRSGQYDWEFVTAPNGAVADSGTATCVTNPLGQSPAVSITSPADGASFSEGSTVTFAGSASDFEDGDISAGLAWTSNLAGALGAGSPLEVTGLTSGTHVVTAAATDADGNISTAQISVVVFSGQASSMVEVRVGASADDAEEKANGKISPANSDIELVFDGSNQVVGIRFASLAVPAKATISNAWVQFGTDEVKSAAVSLLVQAQAADQASGFTTALRSISSRPRTSAQVAWAPVPWLVVGEAGAAQRTPNLAAVIQEVVNRPGWVAGNPLVILITGSGVRTAESWDGKAALAPLLHVEFSPPPG